jgi:hypothetical protein
MLLPCLRDRAKPLSSFSPLATISSASSGSGRCSFSASSGGAGYKRSSRDAYVQRLRERGYVGHEGDRIVATRDGIAALGAYEPLPTGTALRERVLGRLPKGERRILECLIARYPHGVARQEIDATTSYQRSSRDAYLHRLGARELVEARGREVKASDNLFD